MRSFGLTPQEFVRQVYYVQEGTLLDFWPTDDKYKEVVVEANLQLQKLQETEDWSWLRSHEILGHCWGGSGIPEFELPAHIYKPAQGHKDAVRLHPVSCRGHCFKDEPACSSCLGYEESLRLPAIQAHWASQSSINNISESLQGFVYVQVPNRELKATYTSQGIVTFNRPLTEIERRCVAETDVILRMPMLHVCDETCPNHVDVDDPDKTEPTPCPHIEKSIFEMIPDPNYMVYATAAAHGVYSPPAALAVQKAADEVKTILSAMRQNDAMKTTPDIMKRNHQTFLTVV